MKLYKLLGWVSKHRAVLATVGACSVVFGIYVNPLFFIGAGVAAAAFLLMGLFVLLGGGAQ